MADQNASFGVNADTSGVKQIADAFKNAQEAISSMANTVASYNRAISTTTSTNKDLINSAKEVASKLDDQQRALSLMVGRAGRDLENYNRQLQALSAGPELRVDDRIKGIEQLKKKLTEEISTLTDLGKAQQKEAADFLSSQKDKIASIDLLTTRQQLAAGKQIKAEPDLTARQKAGIIEQLPGLTPTTLTEQIKIQVAEQQKANVAAQAKAAVEKQSTIAIEQQNALLAAQSKIASQIQTIVESQATAQSKIASQIQTLAAAPPAVPPSKPPIIATAGGGGLDPEKQAEREAKLLKIREELEKNLSRIGFTPNVLARMKVEEIETLRTKLSLLAQNVLDMTGGIGTLGKAFSVLGTNQLVVVDDTRLLVDKLQALRQEADKTTQSMTKAADAQAKLDQKLKESQAVKAGAPELKEDIKRGLGFTTDAVGRLSPAQLNDIGLALDKIFSKIDAGKLTSDQANEMFGRLSGTLQYQLPASLSTTFAQFEKIDNIMRQTAIDANNLAAQTQRGIIAPSVVSGVAPGMGATSQDIKQLTPQIQKLIDLYTSGKSSVLDFEQAQKKLSDTFLQLDAGAKAAFPSIQKMNEVITKNRDEVQRLGEVNKVLTDTFARMGLAPDFLSRLQPGSINNVRASINALANEIVKGDVSLQNLNLAAQNFGTTGVSALTGGAARAAALLGNIKTQVDAAGNSFGITLQGMVRLFQVKFLSQIFFGLDNLLVKVIKESVEFETQMNRIAVILETTGDRIQGFSEKVIEAGVRAGQTKVDVAKAAYNLFAGQLIDTESGVKALNDALDLSKATFSGADDSAKALINTIRAFGLEMDQSRAVSARLFAATTRGGVELKDVDNLVGRTSVSAHALGLSLDEVLSAFISLKQRGVTTQASIATLNAVFNKFAQSGSDLNKIFYELGLVSGKNAISSQGLQKTMQILFESATTGTGRVKELAAALIESDTNVTKLAQSMANLDSTAKRFDRTVGEVTASTAERFKKAKELLEETFFTPVGNLFKKLLVDQVEGWQEFFQGLRVITGGALNDIKPTIEALRLKVENSFDAQFQAADASHKKIEAAVKQVYNKLEAATITHLQTQRAAFQQNNEAIVDNTQTATQLVSNMISTANQRIKTSQDFIRSFAAEVAKSSFEKRIAVLPPALQVEEIQSRINELNAIMDTLFAKGQAAEGRLVGKEIDSLIGKVMDLNNQSDQAAVRTNKQLSQTERHLQTRLELITQTDKPTRAIVQAGQQQLDILKSHAQQYFSITERANRLNELTRFQNLLNIANNELNIEQANQQRIAVEAKNDLNTLETAKAQTGERVNKLLQEENTLLKEQKKLATAPQDLILTLEKIKNIPEKVSVIGPEASNEMSKIIGQTEEFIRLFQQKPSFDLLQQISANVTSIIQTMQQAKVPTIEVDLEKFKAFQKEFATIQSQLLQFTTDLGKSGQVPTRLLQVQQTLAELGVNLPKIADAIEKVFQNIDTKTPNLAVNMNNFKTATKETLVELNNILSIMEKIAKEREIKPIKVEPVIGAIPLLPQVPAFEEPIRFPGGFAVGGMVNGPSGTDSILAKVTAGEYIVNPASTRRYLKELVAINRGQFYPQVSAINTPRYAQGGIVNSNNSSTDVGGINLNITTSGPDMAIREIGQRLAREIKRGTIRFN